MADEPKPWEQFQGAAKPWEQFAPVKPWEQFKEPARQTDAPEKPGFTRSSLAKQFGLGVAEGALSLPDIGPMQAVKDIIPAARKLTGINIPDPSFEATANKVLGYFGLSPEQYPAQNTPEQITRFGGNLASGLLIPGIGAVEGAAKLPQAGLKGLQKILSPQSVSLEAGAAAASIRSAGGRAARDTATTAAEMEPYHRVVNAMTPESQLKFIEYVEGRSTGAKLPPSNQPLQEFADTLRKAAMEREAKLAQLPETANMGFVDDYLAHFWQDPQAPQKIAAARGGAGKQGSAASLKARTVPTYAEGIAAGLKPLTTDPIEIAMRYVTSMDRFIASTEVLGQAKRNGIVKYVRPKTMGASGHPDSFKVPEGYAPLEGRGATDATGAKAYAPEDWARVYNNFISKGFHGNVEAGKVYDALQGASNAITSMELGLSGYHAFTMANEVIISDVARGISNIVGGKLGKGLIGTIKAPGAFVRSAMTGKKAEQVYLGRTPGTPNMRKVVNLLTEAGGRAVGKSHAADYRFSSMGSYWTAFRRGALKQQMRESLANIKAQPLIGVVKETGRAIGRIMETVAQPIFEKYIPRLKNGAFYDTMHDWLEANPTATHEQQVAMARKIWDSIDNRFGEMVQDNIFWNKTLKQTAQLGMRSYSWNLGTVREIGGGASGAIRDPRKLSMAHPDYDPRVAYVVAMPIVVATANAVYQYLKTGKSPESADDLIAGRTGGTAPGFGGKGTVPERASLPGYQKDVLGWYNDWKQEALNKQARGLQTVEEMLSGKNWQEHLLSDPNASIPQWLTDYFMHVVGSMIPISIGQISQGHKTGSALGLPETIMGIRPAPGFVQDPEGTARGLKRIRGLEYKREQKSERRQQSQYGGANE